MCTVTLIVRKRGFALGMNRDEKITRIKAHSPSVHQLQDRRALFPFEPGAGTWVGVNDAGVGCALINWYAITARASGSPVSRGRVVTTTLAARSVSEMEQSLATLPLVRVNPFRLIGVFPKTREVVEWRWNLKKLAAIRYHWETTTWISSGFDEAGAQVTRGKTFADARGQNSFGRLEWLRRLHRSHKPVRGPYSTCMHRDDAATVSYAEIEVSLRKAVMRYCDGSPCKKKQFAIQQLKIIQSAREENQHGRTSARPEITHGLIR